MGAKIEKGTEPLILWELLLHIIQSDNLMSSGFLICSVIWFQFTHLTSDQPTMV